MPTDILVVDDNSQDGTGEFADQVARENSNVHVLHRAAKDGLGRAYIAGFQWALKRDYEFVMEMDADLSHAPEAIPAFVEAANDADLVLGTRYRAGIRVINWPLSRLLLSLAAAQYVRGITGMPFTDPTGGFKLFRWRALEALDLERIHSNGYSFQIELTHRLWRRGFRIEEIPITFTDRFHGSSKMSRRIVREALISVWRLLAENRFRRRPLKRVSGS